MGSFEKINDMIWIPYETRTICDESTMSTSIPSLLLVYNPTVFWWESKGGECQCHPPQEIFGLMKGFGKPPFSRRALGLRGWHWGGPLGLACLDCHDFEPFDSMGVVGHPNVDPRCWGIPLTAPWPSILQLLHAPGDSKRATRRFFGVSGVSFWKLTSNISFLRFIG